MKKIFFIVCLCCMNLIYAENVPDYFKTLQTKRVQSTNYVEWHQFGPGMAGYCEEMWCHPEDSRVMFLSPDMGNSYGTWNSGESWYTIKEYDGSGRDLTRIKDIAFSKNDPSFGLAINGSNLYSTNSKGRSWKNMNVNLLGLRCCLSVDPSNDDIWYMGSGDFWNVKKNHRNVACLKDHSIGHTSSKSYGSILKSINKGLTWKKITKGIPSDAEFGRIIINPNNTDILIAATNYGILKSLDKGESWKVSNKGLAVANVRDLDYFYDKKTKTFELYALDQTAYIPSGKTIKSIGGIYCSKDEGKTWENMTGNLAVNMNKMSDYTISKKYFRTIAFWLGISEKQAAKKYPIMPDSILDVFNRLRINPVNRNEIFICHNMGHDYGFTPGDIWKSSNKGFTWKTVARTGTYWTNGKFNEYWKSRNNETNANVEFGHLAPKVNREPMTNGGRFLVLNRKGEIFTCIDQQVLKSSDGGSSWVEIDDYETKKGSKKWIGRGDSNLPGRFMLLQTGIVGRMLLCCGEHGLWQTTSFDGEELNVAVEQLEGQKNKGGSHSISTVAVDPIDPNVIYTLQFRQDHRGELRRSSDAGKTWQTISEPLPCSGNKSQVHLHQNSLLIDFKDNKTMYFCVESNPISEVSPNRVPKDFKNFGIHKSTDGGYHWKLINTGLPTGCSVRRIIIDPKNSSILYAALSEGKKNVTGGLYISKNKGENWEKVAIPTKIKSVNNVFIDKNNNYMYISCGSQRGTSEQGGVWVRKYNVNLKHMWKKIFYMPYVWQTETSPLDPKQIVVSVAGQRVKNNFNPGAYVSNDGGKSWQKINRNIGQPDAIVDIKPDPYELGRFWCALKGSGWAVGYTKDFIEKN